MNETWWVDPTQLDDQQKQILTEPPETEMLVVGPPGSGKTNILMLRANYVRSVAPRVLFLTFTRTLAEFLRSGPNVGRADQIQIRDIKTFMGLANELIRENGGEIPKTVDDFDADRTAKIGRLSDVLAAAKVGKIYDVVFIDEVQDLLEAELSIIRSLAWRLNAAGDSRQRIYSHREGIPSIERMVGRTVTLEKHYRIGERICRLADQILPPASGDPPLLEGCNYPEELRQSSVEAVPCQSAGECFDACLAKIKEQQRYIVDEPIGVLCPTGSTRDAFWTALEEDGDLADISICQRSSEYQPFGPNSLVRVMTVASAKGCEFRAVHILDAERFSPRNRELAFTAVTRAKTEVRLYHIGPLAGHMVPAGETLPPLSSIF